MIVRQWIHKDKLVVLSWRDLINLAFGKTLLANGIEVKYLSETPTTKVVS